MSRKIIHIKTAFPRTKDHFDETHFKIGWPWLLCNSILEYTSDFEVEYWRSGSGIQSEKQRTINGVKIRIFPSIQFRSESISISMLKEIEVERNKNEIILHIHGPHRFFAYFLIKKFKKSPIVVRHAGSDPPIPFYDFYSRNSIIKRFYRAPFLYLKRNIETHYFNNIDFYTTGGIGEVRYLSNILKYKGEISLMKGGTSFSDLRPGEKTEARKRLGFSINRKIILTIGCIGEIKGVDNAIKILDSRNDNFDFDLVWLGEISDNNYYRELQSRGVLCTGTLKWNRSKDKPHTTPSIADYIRAADLYVNFSTHPTLTDIGGLNTSIVEACACNIPVISMKLKNFPSLKEIRYIGYQPKDLNDMARSIRKFLYNKPSNLNPRKYAKKYYDSGVATKTIINKYRRLFRVYYGDKKI